MGSVYERDGKLELADRQYADATKSAAGNLSVTLQYVAFLQRQGRVAQAEDVLTESANANTKSIDTMYALSQILLPWMNWTVSLAVHELVIALAKHLAISDVILRAAF